MRQAVTLPRHRPIALSPQEALAQDIAWAQANAEPVDMREAFRFKHLLLLAPCFSERAPADVVAKHRAATQSATAASAGGRGWGPLPATTGGKKGKRARAAAAPTADAAVAAVDEDAALGLGDGWLTHYLHFEEELLTQAAAISFTFPVEAPADKAAASVPVSVAAPAPKKRKAARGGASAAADSDDDDDVMASAQPLHGPQSRRVIVIPAASHGRCVDAMKQLLALAADAE